VVQQIQQGYSGRPGKGQRIAFALNRSHSCDTPLQEQNPWLPSPHSFPFP